MPLTSTDWVLVGATIAGPVLAVQAQKVVERLTEARKRKFQLFRTLMATRAVRLSGEHVRALNMIDIEFSGRKILWLVRYQFPNEKKVVGTWRTYLDSLTPLPQNATEDDQKRWNDRTRDNFIELLSALTASLGFEFDKVQLSKGIYSPQAHGDIEAAELQIRNSLVKILSGQQPLPMAVKEFPYSQQAVDLQAQVQAALLASLRGDHPFKVFVETASEDEGKSA